MSIGRVHVHVTHAGTKKQIVYFCKLLWYNYSMDITLTKHTEEKFKNPNCAFCNAENADSLTIQTCEKNYSTVFLCENCLKEFKEKVAQL